MLLPMTRRSRYLDDVVGNVAQALRDRGLWNNTLFVWCAECYGR
jgi:arylsulfatase A-like enzyme